MSAGCFEAEFEAHHEVDPGGGVLFESGEYGSSGDAVDGVLLKDVVDFFFFVVRAINDLSFFALTFRDVVLGIATGGEIAAEAHGDGAGGDLGEAGYDDDASGGYSGEAGGEGEGNGEAVRESDDDVADSLAGLEVTFDVGIRVLMRKVMHGGSVLQLAVGSWKL